MKNHYDICMVGFWYGANYGSLLNGYAEYRLLKDVFHKEVLMLSKPNAQANDPEIVSGHNVEFIKKYYDKDDISPNFSYSELTDLNNICDCFCAGSDQIWNYNLSFRERMYLPFVNDEKKMISFASSFGHKKDVAPEQVRKRLRDNFSRYSAISVREQFDVDILRENYGINGTLVFEPVFCIDKKYYIDIASSSNFDVSEPYILTYILDPTQEKRDAILYYAKEMGIRAINILDGDSSNNKRNSDILNLPNTYQGLGVADFLKLFMNASYVITDSFHGSAFSIIFNKPFFTIANYGRGFERFPDLLGRLKLMDRLVTDPKNIPHDVDFLKNIDYTETNKIIESEAKRTVEWFRNAVNTPKEDFPDIIIKEEQIRLEKIEYENIKRIQEYPDFIKVRILATLLRDYGVKHVVLSPGGRDVPIVRIFENNDDTFKLHRIVDERSAAYYGLGLATQLNKPVACVCTSGTAASNFLPAVTEAYFTEIPLIMITADRYQIYHGHGEDQTIPQNNIYRDVIKKEITIPEGSGYNVEYQTRRDISECILEATHNVKGPVHINIAIGNIANGARLDRAYWKILPKIYPHILRVGFNDGESNLMRWTRELIKSKRILIVYGQNYPASSSQIKNIENFASKYNCVILTDFISNLHCKYSLKTYNMLNSISQQEFNDKLSPDILISVGGKQLMNDPLTYKIRNGKKNIRHWSVYPDGRVRDFYFRLSSVLEMSQDKFFEWFSQNAGDIKNDEEYYSKWIEIKDRYKDPVENDFNSLYVQSKFIPKVPKNAILHLGVGQSFYTTRRYTINPSVDVFCNMGTNGIDGCTSTFMGQCAAIEDERLCFLIVGDLSFFYDMNSIWNKPLKKNMRILLVNNSGSGLLRGNNLRGITSYHTATAKNWVQECGFEYISANNIGDYTEQLQYFISDRADKALFFEVFCK